MFDPHAWLGALILGGITLGIFFAFMGIFILIRWLMNKEEKNYHERKKGNG